MIRVADSEADVVQFGFMTPLDWAKKEVLFPSAAVLSATASIPPPEQFFLKVTKVTGWDVLYDCSMSFYKTTINFL